MVENKVILRAGLLALFVPGLVLAAPYFLDGRSNIRLASLRVPDFVYPVAVTLSMFTTAACGLWSLGRWFKGRTNGEGRRAEHLVVGILDLLTLPLLFVIWLLLTLKSFGLQMPLM